MMSGSSEPYEQERALDFTDDGVVFDIEEES